MKTLIRRVSYKTGELDNSSKWFMWNEVCDRCGKPTESNGYMTLFPEGKTVDTNEKDYCMTCLLEILDAKLAARNA